ncbi:hypothetical protein ACLQ24_25095 [Micromonospora sp. DT4]|uniref:hypothetical protein n=1 Tax=Micromonospora sp. DT4 TaxID=3393438 RepID=UPI003CF26FF9
MIVVHVNKTWPLVQEGRMTQDDAVLGFWPIADEKLKFCDVLAAVFENKVVATYDITGHSRGADKKVTFTGSPSTTWAHLIDQPTPAAPWGRQGDAWPVKYVETAVVAGGDVLVEKTDSGSRAVLDDVVMILGEDQHITVVVPAGRSITIQTAKAA